jgi:Flp pilus assembly protein TadB
VTFSFILIGILLASGLWLLCGVLFWHDTSFTGSSALRRYGKWQEEKKDFWASSIMRKLTGFASRFVFLDGNAEEQLSRQLNRAGLSIAPKEFTARRYVILFLGVVGAGICGLMKFWLGILLCVLLAGFGLMKQRDALQAKLKEKDEAIAMEMPRFVRTICRNLRGNRDIYAALTSYRKVSGPVLGAELDILLAHMGSGNIQSALQQFQTRIGSEEVYRLCSTLLEIDRGIDQTATLDYLADDMARQAKLKVQKQLSTRPAKMRRTYYPAVGVCVAMILYVLVVFVVDQLSTMI